MDQTQMGNDAPLPTHSTPQSEQTSLLAQQKPLVTIVHASVGSGHKAAANAIAQAFDLIRGTKGIPEDVEIEVLDILDFGRIKFDGNKTAASFTGATRPIYDLTWRYALTGHLLWGGGTAWSRIMFPAFNEYIRRRRPIAVVATHITAANVAVGARVITGIDYPVICVPTDYEVEGWWPHKDTALFCVANEFMAETLRPRKVPEAKIRITGIPIRAGFDTDYNREEELQKFNLPVDKTIVLVMAGASLPQPYVRFRAEMDRTLPFLRSLEDMHFIFLPGKDTEYATRLKTLFDAMKLENVTVLDYVDDMAALMHGCDLAILKSGGLTVTECLCAHLPMILLGKSYGQEKANTTMLTGMGASMHVTTARAHRDAPSPARPPRVTQSLTNQRRSATPPPRSRRHSHRSHGARRQTPKAQTSLLPLLLGRKTSAYPLASDCPLAYGGLYIIPCSNILATLRNCARDDI